MSTENQNLRNVEAEEETQQRRAEEEAEARGRIDEPSNAQRVKVQCPGCGYEFQIEIAAGTPVLVES